MIVQGILVCFGVFSFLVNGQQNGMGGKLTSNFGSRQKIGEPWV
jgi:hypothetical protein